MTYTPPLRDIRFALNEIAGLPGIAQLPGFGEATPELADSILTEAGRVAAETLAPLNRVGDKTPSRLDGRIVKTPPGWKDAWQVLMEGGWNGLAQSPEYGGMGLPHVLNLAVHEMWNASNMAFALCPLLTQGAVHAIALYGTPEQKARYLPNMVSGAWTGTMNLTEPQAGSDLAAVRTKAVPDGSGGYRISGQKIFITYGDHDLTDNIVHLVLARLPDAPAGVKGISLFIVPKTLVGPDGAAAGDNDVVCASLEHKLGIHGSPTAVLVFGEKGGALGELVGEPNRGLEYMFAMMNEARLNVGVQGLSIADRAYQQALAYARERVQGKPLGTDGPGTAPIIDHPDVRRMLVGMKAKIEAMRGLLYEVAANQDIAKAHPDETVRAAAQRRVDLMVPIAKGWCTETGNEIASLAVQVHGGMGFIEETGAAQHFRDARIITIYEGTTGIQANDLVGRKLMRDKGAALRELAASLGGTVAALKAAGGDLAPLGDALATAGGEASAAATYILETAGKGDLPTAFAGAVPFLTLMGLVAGADVLARGALAAQRLGNQDGAGSRLALAQFYATHFLPQVPALSATVRYGSGTVFAADVQDL
jgi:3-(methylthio)propanoyl-CoA dehydrogenase